MAKKEPTLSEIKLLILEMKETIRQENAQLYAIKLIEKIVFGMLAFILMAILGAVVAGVIK